MVNNTTCKHEEDCMPRIKHFNTKKNFLFAYISIHAWSVDDGTICFDGYWREAPCESTIKRNYKRFIKLIVKVCVLKVSCPTCFRLLRQRECSNSDNYGIKLNEWDELACSVEADGSCASLHVTSTNAWWRCMQWIHNHDTIVAFLALQMSAFFCSATIIKFPSLIFQFPSLHPEQLIARGRLNRFNL